MKIETGINAQISASSFERTAWIIKYSSSFLDKMNFSEKNHDFENVKLTAFLIQRKTHRQEEFNAKGISASHPVSQLVNQSVTQSEKKNAQIRRQLKYIFLRSNPLHPSILLSCIFIFSYLYFYTKNTEILCYVACRAFKPSIGIF